MGTPKRRIKSWIRSARRVPELLLAGIGAVTVPFLPRVAVLALARLGAEAALWGARGLTRIGHMNLGVAYGDTLSARERRALLRESYRVFALVVLDLFWFSRFRVSRLRRYVSFSESIRYYREATPGIVVTGHLGNWEVIGQATHLIGQPIVSVAMPLKNPWVDALLGRLRRGTGQGMASRQGAVRVLLGALRQGRHIALLLDQNTLPREGGLFVPFFGLLAPISLAPVTLARRVGAPIVVAASRVEAGGHYVVECHPPLHVGAQSDEAVLSEVARRLEAMIRARPGQWLWTYKRWKYLPPGDSGKAYPAYTRRPAPPVTSEDAGERATATGG